MQSNAFGIIQRSLCTPSIMSIPWIYLSPLSQSSRRLFSTSVPTFVRNIKSVKKRLDVAIVGAPNAGKSQLLNVLVQSPVAAVSRKRHTTRSGILGARTMNQTQLLFIDTPGFLKMETAKQEGLFKDLVKLASRELDRADYTLIVVDAARKLDESLKEALVYLMLRAHHSTGRDEIFFEQDDTEYILREKFAIVLNKVDLVHPKDKLLDLATELAELGEACVRYKWDLDGDEEGRDGDDDHSSIQNRKISYHDVPKVLLDAEKAASVSEADNCSAKVGSSLSTSDQSEDELLELAAQYPPIFYISALKEDGIHDIIQHLAQLATPCDSWGIPQEDDDMDDDLSSQGNHVDVNSQSISHSATNETQSFNVNANQTVTTMSYTERVQEIIREKLFRCLHQEVPFSITQVNRVFRFIRLEPSGEKMAVRIDQDLIVRSKSHYNLVTGRAGMTLKRIQDTARRDLIQIMPKGCIDVILNLHVKLSRSRSSLNTNRALESDRQGTSSN